LSGTQPAATRATASPGALARARGEWFAAGFRRETCERQDRSHNLKLQAYEN
jgi:hypothetical protein